MDAVVHRSQGGGKGKLGKFLAQSPAPTRSASTAQHLALASIAAQIQQARLARRSSDETNSCGFISVNPAHGYSALLETADTNKPILPQLGRCVYHVVAGLESEFRRATTKRLASD
jgi:hypothetical protein